MTSAEDFDKKYGIVDIQTPQNTYLSGHYKKSFAYVTLHDRLPKTLTSILDSLAMDTDELVAEYGEEAREEIENVIGSISKLKNELQTDKHMQIFTGKEPDKEVWNDFISKLPYANASYFKTCWLYAECYIYRRVSSFFEGTKTLQNFDYFAKQKKNALIISTKALEEIIQATRNVERSEEMFIRLLKLNLWGNKCDLSITAGKEVKPRSSPFENVLDLDSKIIVNNVRAVWECISGADPNKPTIVDFVCDNAGYELFADFILAEYIVEQKFASKVRFHVKAIPWFISDVTANDFHWTLEYLKEHQLSSFSDLGKKLLQYVADGKFELMPAEHFWSSPYEYYKMNTVDKDLYKKLAEAHLVLFKGDLNYRKLIGDYSWHSTEMFLTCLRGFQPTNLCALRTVKADQICGLPSGLAEDLTRKNPGWMLTGEYGLIQFAEGNYCGCPT